MQVRLRESLDWKPEETVRDSTCERQFSGIWRIKDGGKRVLEWSLSILDRFWESNGHR